MSELIRFLIFGAVGAFNALLDVVIYKFLVNFIETRELERYIKNIHKSVSKYTFSHTISFVLTVISSYFLNKSFTFGDSKKVDAFQIYKFFTVAVFSWLITTWVLNFLMTNKKVKTIVDTIGFFETNKTQKKSRFIEHWATIAKLITIGISMITNFIGYKIFVF
jgi:putative flippase GtrA